MFVESIGGAVYHPGPARRGSTPMDSTVQTEFSIYLADRPGELAGVLEAARAAGVEIQGLVVGHNHSKGLVRMLGTPEEALRRILEQLVESGAGPCVEAPVVVVPIADRPGLFRELAAELALDDVNLQHAYAIPPRPGSDNGHGMSFVLRVSDVDQTRKTLDRLA